MVALRRSDLRYAGRLKQRPPARGLLEGAAKWLATGPETQGIADEA